MTEATWSRGGGGDCIRLTGLPAGARVRVFPGWAVSPETAGGAGGLPSTAGRLVRDGEEYLLVANSAHGLVKIACRDIDSQSPLTQPRQPVGVPRETKDLQGIRRLASLGDSYVLALQSDDAGRQHLRSLKTASL